MSSYSGDAKGGWWSSRPAIFALVLIAALPLILPAVPPLTDLPGHMGRYRVELADPASVLRTQYFAFKWAVMGNLGVDLLIVPLAKLFGLELAVKLIVMAIPPLTVLGMLLVAREAHGRVPPTALFALPLAYGFPFQWGFVNFALSMALALLAFGVWLRLGRTGHKTLRVWLFVPIGMAIWFAHSFGWGVLGLLAFSADFVRERERGRGWIASWWHAVVACLPLLPPLLLMIAWRSGHVAGETTDWFNWAAKYVYLISILRNHWMPLDLACAGLLGAMIVMGMAGTGLRMNRTLALAALILVVTYIVLPRIVLGSAYADMRLAPYMIAIAVLALEPKGGAKAWSYSIAAVALAIFVGRIALATERYATYDRIHKAHLAAIDHMFPNARVFTIVNLDCLSRWDSPRNDHIGALAITRREAFVNGQWSMPGAQLLSIIYAPAKGYSEDPTQILRPKRCSLRRSWSRYPAITQKFPRNAFDFLWLIDMPRDRLPAPDPGLKMVWQGATGALYRVVGSATAASETPKGSDPRATQ